jgi:hypothetical protein
VHLHVAVLTDAVGAVGRLGFDRRVPPEVEMDDVAGGGQVQPGAAGLEREQKDALGAVVLKAFETISSRFFRVTPPCRNCGARP